MGYILGNILAAILVIAVLLVISRYFSLWLRAYVTGTRISMLSLMMMSLRNVSPRVIVDCQVMAVQAGLPRIPTSALETLYLAGGNVPRVILALIVAHRASIDLEWDTAAAIDLAGRDILEAVQVSVNPRVIDCPDPLPGRADTLVGVAQDGIQLRVRVRVTVRTNISQLVGGATESTVVARVGQGIVSSIGSCVTYREALADPMIISRQVLALGLDSQTVFSIVSIDIADIDVGENIGAQLRIEQANADFRVALASAEKRRAMAMARRQEMVALTRQREAEVVLAEALIPPAIAGAYEAGLMRRADHPVQFARDVAPGFPSVMPPPATAS